MSQPEESRAKTTDTDDVLLRPGEDPDRRTDAEPPRRGEQAGSVQVEADRDGPAAADRGRGTPEPPD